jgi:glycosyltransferase involved in cell wall biosynthesis
MSAPRISVVIPTFNRRERLGRVLSALVGQTTPPSEFEVIVVDDGSADGTSEWLSLQSFPFELRCLRQQNAGPARARNKGIEAARGEKVLFLDDDVVPCPELMAEHLRVHEAEGRSVVVLGTLSSLPHYAQPWVAWEQVQVEKQYVAMERGDYAPSFRQFWTGNASVARAELMQAGLFDVTLKRGEDVELGRRMAAQGVGYVFNARARGLHHAERTLASFCHAHASYGEMEVAMLESLPDNATERILAENWARLHVAQRGVLRLLLAIAPLRSVVLGALKFYLGLPFASRLPRVSRAVCSLLANTLYWQSSVRTLGPVRAGRVLAGAPPAGGAV